MTLLVAIAAGDPPPPASRFSLRPQGSRWRVLFRALFCALTLFVSSGTADASASAEDGSGVSYWGTIPSRVDSLETKVVADPRPLWEYPLLVPYRIVEAPIRLFGLGTGAAYRALDRSGAIGRITRLLGPKQVPYGFLLSFRAGGLTGYGGGITLYHDNFLGPHNRLRLRSLATSSGTQKATLGAIFGEGQPTEIEAGVGYRLRRNARYFGLGPESYDYNKSFYSQETSWAGVQVTQKLHRPLHLHTGVMFSGIGTRLPHEDRVPALRDEFRTLPKGYGDLSTGITLSAGLLRDTTVESGRPQTGSVQRIRATYFTSTGDEARANFWSYRADLETFVPLWFTERALALRSYLQWLDDDRTAVPFQRLLTNDDPDLFRGYRDYRWRDRGITALSLEYRWPLWANRRIGTEGLDAYLLADIGQVFGEFRRIGVNNLTTSYGGGVRLITTGGFSGRLEVAFSDEETVVRLASDQIFQYARSGLFHGRDQTALR